MQFTTIVSAISPTKMVSVENRTLEGGGFLLKQSVWDAARTTIEEWTGQRLAECSLYGIRIYEEGILSQGIIGLMRYSMVLNLTRFEISLEGAVLATHVDRLPLVSFLSFLW